VEEGFATVVPGKTTAADLNWWLEQRARDVGLRTGASGSNVPRVVRAREQHPAGPDAGRRATNSDGREVGIYGQSIGNNSHDIGARIAPDVPFAYGERVRFPLVEGEFVSMEFHLTTLIPEWGGMAWYSRFKENGPGGPDAIRWLVPRQVQLLLIGPTRGMR
jgi:hypothetical protein